ncbi:chromosome segregation protein SMC [Pseudomonas sp. C1C7]|nr:chromosome segregation protein SMC [Pseudomonas sp. C1C7]
MGSRETKDQSDCTEQARAQEIQALKDRRDQLLSEAERLHTQLRPYEAALESDEPIDPDQKRDIRNKYSDLKRVFDSRQYEAHLLDQKISRREELINCDSLMAGYVEAMTIWKADEQALNEKRQSLSIRLEQIQQQATDDMAKARQAETDAATAYAQAVAWGDTEGEKNANTDAVKAAKNLATATEHNRRQQLIITALEQELITVDRFITEAQEEHSAIERKALLLAHTVLEEKWNQAAQALLDVGGKLWASYRLIDRDQIALMNLVLPEQGENFHDWKSRDLAERSYKYTAHDVLMM